MPKASKSSIVWQPISRRRIRQDPQISYVKFRRMYADYALSQQVPSADFAKIQQKWLTDLETFANENPKSPDAAEAMLQLGMSYEFAGYHRQGQGVVPEAGEGLPQHTSGREGDRCAASARLGRQAIPLHRQGHRGGPIDLAAQPYRGRVTLIQYWATWDDRCKEDMDALKELYSKFGGQGGFEIIGVCLDRDPKAMQPSWPRTATFGGKCTSQAASTAGCQSDGRDDACR